MCTIEVVHPIRSPEQITRRTEQQNRPPPAADHQTNRPLDEQMPVVWHSAIFYQTSSTSEAPAPAPAKHQRKRKRNPFPRFSVTERVFSDSRALATPLYQYIVQILWAHLIFPFNPPIPFANPLFNVLPSFHVPLFCEGHECPYQPSEPSEPAEQIIPGESVFTLPYTGMPV